MEPSKGFSCWADFTLNSILFIFFFSKLKIWKCLPGLSVAINGSYNILNLHHYFMDLGYVAGSTPPPMQARRGPGMIFIYLISDQNCF